MNQENLSYHPYLNGRYTTSMGIMKLDKDMGNGKQDAYFFQRDKNFEEYINAKKNAASKDAFGCFYALNCDQDLLKTIYDFMREHIFKEHGVTLDSSASLENLSEFAYHNQEDFTVVCRDEMLIAAVHLPSGWDPAKYIGKSWHFIHKEIPGLETLLPRADKIVKTITEEGPFKRFVWGLQFDNALDRNPNHCQPRRFDGKNFFVRVERQVLIPFPKIKASLFLIRPYLIDSDEIVRSDEKKNALRSALLSMTVESRKYKGIEKDFEFLIEFLK